MKLVVCSVRDRAVDSFMPPFCVAHVGGAIRGFADEVNNASSPWHKHPDDYDLYVLGTFDDEIGTFECHQPRQVAVGKDMLKPVEKVRA